MNMGWSKAVVRISADWYCGRDDAAVRDRTAHNFLGGGIFLLVVAGIWALVDAFLIPGIVRGFNTALAMKFAGLTVCRHHYSSPRINQNVLPSRFNERQSVLCSTIIRLKQLI